MIAFIVVGFLLSAEPDITPQLDPDPKPNECKCLEWACPKEGPCTCKREMCPTRKERSWE